MKRILIFGNSGSGKSTLAKQLANTQTLAHLDLDTLAWQDTLPPTRKPLAESQQAIGDFIALNDAWVIEGCYADLLETAIANANEVIFMNLPVEACMANAKNRPWEPHKYPSKAAQDANLSMLLDWISQYSERSDEFSAHAHRKLYEAFPGNKTMITQNQ